jgi:hypothetical protein
MPPIFERADVLFCVLVVETYELYFRAYFGTTIKALGQACKNLPERIAF